MYVYHLMDVISDSYPNFNYAKPQLNLGHG